MVGFGGDGEDFVDLEAFLECAQIAGALVAAEAIDLGGDDGEGASGGAEPVDELAVAGLGWDVGVDEADAEVECGARGEIGLNEGGPAGGDGFGDFGVAVAGEVGECQARALSLIQEQEKIDGAGAAWCGRDLGGLLAGERVQQARFTDVGAAEESDLRHAGRGELFGGKGGEKELSGVAHAVF